MRAYGVCWAVLHGQHDDPSLELWGRTKVTNAIDSTAGLVRASMRKLTRCILLGSVVALVLVASRPAYAQNPGWDHEAKPNADYPEIDSKCVHSDYSSDGAKSTAEVPGPGMKPGSDPDPICNGLDSSVGTVTCRLMCGDLPAGKSVVVEMLPRRKAG